MDNKEQCRADFEYWHRGEFGYFESLLDYAGEYAAKDIEGRWKSWQASRATSPAPAVVQMTDERQEKIMALAHRWAMATYNKALGKDFEDFDAIQREMRAILSASGVQHG